MFKVGAQLIAWLLLYAACQITAAQIYPSRPVRVVVPFPAGGGVDGVARTFVDKLGSVFGQSFIVDNRAGADGIIGTDQVAKAPADGYMLLFTSVGSLAINPALVPKIPYDSARDFAPITLVADNPMVLTVNPSLPVKSMRDLISLARAKPGQLNYASGGVGNVNHLAMEILKLQTGTNIVHVPYRGGAAGLTDLIAGNVDVMISGIPLVLSQINARKLRAIAVVSDSRMSMLPDVPTMREAGFPRYKPNSWYGFLAPAGTPKEIIGRLNAEAVKVLKGKDVRDSLAQQGNYVIANSSDEFSAYIKSELVTWTQAVKAAGIKAQ